MGLPTAPRPIRIQEVNLDGPLPDLETLVDHDHDHDQVWLVGRRHGVPQAIVELDLTAPTAEIGERLRTLAMSAPTAMPSTRPVPDEELPRISVVVPSIIARIEELARCLQGFERLDYPDYEVVLVDNRRERPTVDALPDLLAQHPNVSSVHESRPGISAARNAGIAAATGEIVVFTDDDVHVDPRWLRAFGERFVREPGLDAVTGLILPAELETPAQIYFERYYGGFSGERTFAPLTLSATAGRFGRTRVTVRDASGQAVRTFALYGVGAYGAGANMGFRRTVLQRLGGFDLALGTGTASRGGEDLATLINVLWNGGQVGYEPAAVVNHKHRREYAELVHQLGGNGLGFTAMLVSLVWHDPCHLLGLGVQLPLAVRRIAAQTVNRARGRRTDRPTDNSQGSHYPSELVRRELAGMPQGPLAYLRSRRAVARWTAAHAPERTG